MKWILGSELSKQTQTECLRRFVHRYTGEHRPTWAISEPYDGHPHFRDDAEWLANTKFAITKRGILSMRNHYCESSPVFPYGKPQFPEQKACN